jgi:secondary thiamine-phosphate synthase enzyme
MVFFQKEIVLTPKSRGFHLITGDILGHIPEIKDIKTGIANIFIHHTSASLTINENADPDVRRDMETHFNIIVPDGAKHYKHTLEGPDDMTAHIKSSMLGNSLSIPITDGTLNLGTWQGIYLCEHRNHAGRRKIVITLIGSE